MKEKFDILIFISPYTPQYAPIEHFFGFLKSSIKAYRTSKAINLRSGEGEQIIKTWASRMRPESIVDHLPIDLESWEKTSGLTETQASSRPYFKKSSNNIHNSTAHYTIDIIKNFTFIWNRFRRFSLMKSDKLILLVTFISSSFSRIQYRISCFEMPYKFDAAWRLYSSAYLIILSFSATENLLLKDMQGLVLKCLSSSSIN